MDISQIGNLACSFDHVLLARIKREREAQTAPAKAHDFGPRSGGA